MTVEEIRNLPDEFDFVSNVNPFEIVYHAKRNVSGYDVIWELPTTGGIEQDTFSREKFEKKLFDEQFMVIGEKIKIIYAECDCCSEKVNIADTFLFNGKRYCVDCGYCLVMDIAESGVINIDFSNEDTEGMIVNL